MHRRGMVSMVSTSATVAGKSSSSKLALRQSKSATQNIVFVLGPPGAGKDTQCRRIAHVFGFVLISVGDILRNEVRSPESPFREAIEACMTEGKIVPSEITCKLLERHMQSARKANFLVVGFPRNEENRERWDKQVGNRKVLSFVLRIDCPEDVTIDRCLQRGRLDDTPDLLEKRFNTYLTETQPTMAYFEKQKLMYTVNGNQPEEKVFEEIKRIFERQNFSPEK